MEAGNSFSLGSQVGRYTLEAVVGQGGMGVVYRAFDADLHRHVALKVMTPHLTSATALGRFQREATAVAQLRHPGIAAVFDFGRHGDQPYIVFEWIDGRGLNVVLEEASRLPLDRALKLTAQLGSALDYAHQRGILHRDLKPSNVLLTPDDTPIIIDFGLAFLAGETTTLTMPGALFGTPRYMAPEQFRGEMLDARADLYSLAVIAYEMMAGQPPFVGDSLQALYHQHLYTPPPDLTTLNPDVPRPLAITLTRALAKDAAMRFPSAAAFNAALRGAPPPVEVKGADTMAVTVPVMAVPSTRPPLSQSALTQSTPIIREGGAATVPDAVTPPARPQPRTDRRVIGLVAGLLVMFCLVWAVALGLWARGTPPTGTPSVTPAVALAQPTTVAGFQSPETATPTASSIGAETHASPTLVGAATQTPLIVTVVVTNVVVNITATNPPAGSVTVTFTPSATHSPVPTATAPATAPPTLTTAPGQPTNTPQPTATRTPIPSATNTVVSTATPTRTPSATWTSIPPTATLPPPTATNPPPPTATNTAVPPTATNTATPGCAITADALTVAGNELQWTLTNGGATAATITSINLDWPNVPPQQRLNDVILGATIIATQEDNNPPSALPSEIPWEGSAADRSYAPGASNPLRFLFREPLPATGFSVSVSFDNGCSLNASN